MERKIAQVQVISFAPDAKAVDTSAIGYVKARLAKIGAKDHDGDILEPGCLKETQLRVSAYNHESWPGWYGGGALPIGKGRAWEEDRYLWAEMNLLVGDDLDGTDEARDTYAVIKGLGSLGEWSFSLEDIKAQWDEEDGERTSRRIKSFKMYEVSPVFRGASVGSRTVAAKSAPVANGAIADRIIAESLKLSPELRAYIRAQLAVEGDPEPKSGGADPAPPTPAPTTSALGADELAELRSIAARVA